ncbi:aldehyde-activating protein [Sphingomonas sinipercae]|uniref:Aldehyde-activating protein n=1 Tax=Sphingomonas sinipercae TaxID=2714944 RepID=A0A6G7ZKN0_9SPHN|nr:aldehyde-activating protein [Sphingomonas sinipercae]QIL01493.1 aldehyde-activating protein [Sphingomonas sinipercae]
MTVHAGSCHCGAVTFTYASEQPLAVRACQCSFCRKHGSRNVSDAQGQGDITASLPLTRYRFGLGITDFLLCPTCGSYVAAVMQDGEHWLGTFNLNCFDNPQLELTAEPIVYDSEGSADRIERRRRRWTPTRIAEPLSGTDA